eukprot:CAMPEP_0116994960 /NCGR_PEP_ID=MMETSP0467-20121206/68462_1 /TAXON_ID=283647 /ORGANISM="Mesodinium pulex, Strain SPMC105" /LENGTH=32 /DNA_ID= /DNA_START= /DNA_END= /DNA_ORIENTATION=
MHKYQIYDTVREDIGDRIEALEDIENNIMMEL